ncbi:hypothetical protein AALP_AAs59711U000100, partial [Arabis alpina]
MAPKADTELRIQALEASMEKIYGRVEEVAGAAELAQKETKESLQAVGTQLAEILQRLDGRIKPTTAMEEDVVIRGGEKVNSPANQNQVHTPILEQHWSSSRVDTQVVSLRPRENWLKKLEMPVCDGSDVYGCLAKAERFFKIGQYQDVERLGALSVNMVGKVSKWYDYETRRYPFKDWRTFKLKLLKRFGASRNLTPSERLFGLKQFGTIDDYVEEFEDLSAQVDMEDESLEAIFKNGLKPEIRALVRMLKPRGLDEMIETALDMEDKPVNNEGSRGRSNGGGMGTTRAGGNKFGNKNGGNGKRPHIRLSPAEFDEKKKKGECFKCDEKYFVGHRCANKELRVLLVVNGCEIELEEDGEESVRGDEVEEEQKEFMELSL